MDPQLAAIYGTNQDESDVEKLAAAELAEKLAADEELDVDGYSDEQIEALAQEALGELSEETEQEAAGEETEEAAVEEPEAEKTSAAEELEKEAEARERR